MPKLDKIELNVKDFEKDVKQIDTKLDIITEVVAKTMEEVTGLKAQIEKQDIEVKILSVR